MRTSQCPVWEFEPGDQYIVGLVGGQYASRTVLGVLQRTPLGGALLEVRDDRGQVFRSHMSGKVDRIDRGQPCRDCGELFPYDPDADTCPACLAELGVTAEDVARHAAMDRGEVPA